MTKNQIDFLIILDWSILFIISKAKRAQGQMQPEKKNSPSKHLQIDCSEFPMSR